MKLIVGLGNPGKQYAAHRHNVGFQIVDLLAERHGLRFDSKQGKAQVALGLLHEERVALAKPQTFMNEAGTSVGALMRFYKLEPSDLLVVYDDLDLPLGVLRVRAGGSSGGHNGMKSIIAVLGSDQFARLRVGIDRPPGRMDPAAYVLQNFSAPQQDVIERVRPLAADACDSWLTQGVVVTMNTYNIQAADLSS